MKKIKFMLMSLALIAVVGGALAFKARYSTSFCSTAAFLPSGSGAQYTCVVPGTGTLTCPNPIQATTQTPETDLNIYCTTTPNNVFGCGSAAHPVTCLEPTVNIVAD